MRKKISVIIALFVLVGALMGLLFYIYDNGKAERNFNEIKVDLDLIDLYEQNKDLVGWIRIPDTGIDYPVMRGEKYLFKNFKKEYSESGTPFVQDDWTPESMNSLIYGHNMWVQKTMFNPLHKYEKEDYWLQHKKGVFYVICDSPGGGKEVQERHFTLEHIILTSVKNSFAWQNYINPTTNEELQPYLDWCGEAELHKSGRVSPTGYGVVTLCTCSYHIRGDRHAGRLLGVGHIREIK